MSLKHTKQKLQYKLAYITSPSFYRSQPVEKVRYHLKECLTKDLIELSSLSYKGRCNESKNPSSNAICHYDEEIVVECLFLWIPWKALCESHSNQPKLYSNSELNKHVSILQNMLNILNEFACYHSFFIPSIMTVLLKVLSSLTTIKSNNESIFLIQASICSMLTYCPPSALLSKSICDESFQIDNELTMKRKMEITFWFLQTLVKTKKNDQTLAIGKNIVLSWMQILSSISFRVPVDSVDSDNSTKLSKKKTMKKPKYQTKSMHKQQHDIDFNASRDDTNICIRAKSTQSGEFHHISHFKPNRKSIQLNTTKETPINVNVCVYIMEQIMSMIHVITLNCHKEYKYGILYHSIISFAISKPKCVMTQLLLLWNATCDIRSTYEQGLEKVFHCIWIQFHKFVLEKQWKQSTDVIQMYTNIIIHCKAMEIHDRCWKAFQPIYQYVLEQKTKNNDDHLIQILLRAILHVLKWRSYWLYQNKPRFFDSLLNKLSQTFDNQSYWMLPNASTQEKEQTIYLLHMFHIVKNNDQNHQMLQCHDVTQTNAWEFDFNVQHLHPNSIFQNSSIRLSELLSIYNNSYYSYDYDHDHDHDHDENEYNNDPTNPNVFIKTYYQQKLPQTKNQTNHNTHTFQNNNSISILIKLNDDLFQIIFSFLGYKRMIRAMNVCQSWYQLIDTKSNILWKDIYMKRWPYSQIEKIPLNWKESFITRWKIERSIRSKFNKSMTWKYKVCNVVGCHKILRQKALWDKHLHWHYDQKTKNEKKRELKEKVVSNKIAKKCKI